MYSYLFLTFPVRLQQPFSLSRNQVPCRYRLTVNTKIKYNNYCIPTFTTLGIIRIRGLSPGHFLISSLESNSLLCCAYVPKPPLLKKSITFSE